MAATSAGANDKQAQYPILASSTLLLYRVGSFRRFRTPKIYCERLTTFTGRKFRWHIRWPVMEGLESYPGWTLKKSFVFRQSHRAAHMCMQTIFRNLQRVSIIRKRKINRHFRIELSAIQSRNGEIIQRPGKFRVGEFDMKIPAGAARFGIVALHVAYVNREVVC